MAWLNYISTKYKLTDQRLFQEAPQSATKSASNIKKLFIQAVASTVTEVS